MDSDEIVDVWSKRRGPGYFAVILLSLLISVLVVGGGMFAAARVPALQKVLGAPNRDPDRGKEEVPGLAKVPLDAATQLLSARGLKLLSTGSAADPEIPAGWIVSQTPARGTKVRRGQTVQVQLSSGPPLVNIPPVVLGMSLTDAQRRLTEAGLHVGDVQATGATLRVTGTRPAPGEPVATGSAVTLVVEVVPPPPAEDAPSRGR